MAQDSLETLSINTIRMLSVDAVQKANSGHPGAPMGLAPAAYVLWTRFLKHNPQNPSWPDRDRFVLSAGHGSMLLYSMLHLTGYDVPLDQIKQFRQWGSRTPGHPERGDTPGVETTTGPLGQGFGNGVGMAIAEAHLAARYNRPGFDIVNHFTYAIVSDGDLMEGVAAEAASLAGHLKLGKLIYLYDNNRISLAGAADLSFTEDCARRFDAYGWHTESVEDGNDIEAIDRALRAAREERSRPSLILLRTHIGYGSPGKQDTFEAHGSPLGEAEVKLTKEKLAWPLEPTFYIPAEALTHFREAVSNGPKVEASWKERFSAYARKFPELARELEQIISGVLPAGWEESIPNFPADAKGVATRAASGKILTAIATKLPTLIGGSADLNPSTFTMLPKLGDFESPERKFTDKQGSAGGVWDYSGRNLHFGVREHGMGAAINGIAAHGGIIPFGSTFLIFSDYMRPSIRLAALMGLGVIYVFTHDSIAVGEDGPTHQPVEQLAALRAIPRLIVIRPGDANETAVAWRVAIESRACPVALSSDAAKRADARPQPICAGRRIAQRRLCLGRRAGRQTRHHLDRHGSEVSLVVAAREKLAEQKIQARVVSMPSWELFDQQPQAYREAVFPKSVRARLAVEAALPQGWHRYVGDGGDIVGVERFGASAPGNVVMEKLGFTVSHVVERATALLGK